MNPMLSKIESIPIAMLNRRMNHCPTIVRLTTESALCPNPRLSVINTAIQKTAVDLLIA